LERHPLCPDELTRKIIGARRQVPLSVSYRGVTVGEYFADIVAEDKVILELKSVDCLLTEHQTQLINYLTATGHDTGLLINFGRPRLEYKRCHPRSREEDSPIVEAAQV
jgi:GxxExxY protein